MSSNIKKEISNPLFAKEGFYIIIPNILLNLLIIFILNWIWNSEWNDPYFGWNFSPWFFFSMIFLGFFFRNPTRKPEGMGILAPTDGKITLIKQKKDIITFYIELNVLNVHVQKSPINGKVVNVYKIRGKHNHIFLIRDKSRDSDYHIPLNKNSRRIIEIVDDSGIKMSVAQISGVFARRCITRVKKDYEVKKGQTIGIIMFGSLVKFEIRGDFKIVVKKGDSIKGGKTVLLQKQGEK